jgi:hypothetical protein
VKSASEILASVCEAEKVFSFDCNVGDSNSISPKAESLGDFRGYSFLEDALIQVDGRLDLVSAKVERSY